MRAIDYTKRFAMPGESEELYQCRSCGKKKLGYEFGRIRAKRGYTRNRRCVDCQHRWSMAYKENSREFAAPPCPIKQAKKREDARRNQLRIKYGLTLEDYEAMLTAQSGGCAICGSARGAMRNGKSVKLHVDHNHQTGRVRGLLCTACNGAVGWFEKQGMQEGIRAYLSRYDVAQPATENTQPGEAS